MVIFSPPGVSFDFASFSFQVPICGSAAKQAAPAKKQNARVNPIVFVFMRSIEPGFPFPVNVFFQANSRRVTAWARGVWTLVAETCRRAQLDPRSSISP